MTAVRPYHLTNQTYPSRCASPVVWPCTAGGWSLMMLGYCDFCGGRYSGNANQKFCSRSCASNAARRSVRRRIATADHIWDCSGTRFLRTTSATSSCKCNSDTGAAHELIVSVDMLRRGWDVYRAISAGCGHDLVVGIGDRLLTVQVSTGKMYKTTSLVQHCKNRQFQNGKCDVLALVTGDMILYAFRSPEDEVLFRNQTVEAPPV